MNINQFLLKPNLQTRKQLSQLNKALEPPFIRAERHRLSEPRGKVNLVKINKHKLPLDFFPKQDSFSRRESNNRFNFPNEYSEQFRIQNKSQSQRKHFSPQKTSFFGSQEDLESKDKSRECGGNRFLSRKFQTRQDHKRDLFALEPTRKLNTAAKAHKHQVLQLYPYDHDPQIYQLLTNSSKTQNLRPPLKKGNSTKLRQHVFLQDPQSSVEVESSLILKQGATQAVSKQMNKTKNQTLQQDMNQFSNITFYNAKSSCFPPINRGLGRQL